MKRDVKQMDASRRNFMHDAAAAGLGTFVAAAMPTSTLAAPAEEAGGHAKGKGYRLSRHVLDYYKSIAS